METMAWTYMRHVIVSNQYGSYPPPSAKQLQHSTSVNAVFQQKQFSFSLSVPTSSKQYLHSSVCDGKVGFSRRGGQVR